LSAPLANKSDVATPTICACVLFHTHPTNQQQIFDTPYSFTHTYHHPHHHHYYDARTHIHTRTYTNTLTDWPSLQCVSSHRLSGRPSLENILVCVRHGCQTLFSSLFFSVQLFFFLFSLLVLITTTILAYSPPEVKKYFFRSISLITSRFFVFFLIFRSFLSLFDD